MSESYHRRATGLLPVVLVSLALAGVAAPASAQHVAFPPNVLAQTILFNDAGAGEYEIVGTHSFGVYRSDPAVVGSVRWLDSNSGLTLPLVVNDLQLLDNGDILAAAWGQGGLHRSTDGGATWTVIPPAAFDAYSPYSVQALTQSPVDEAIYLTADDGNTFRSTDGGASFEFRGQLPGGSSQLPWSLEAHPSDAGTIYAGTFGYGVFVSTDFGVTWNEVTDNLSIQTETAGHVFDIRFDPANEDRLYVATGRGVWRFDDLTDADGEWVRVSDAANSITLADGTVLDDLSPEVRSLDFDAGGTLYMATWGYGVLTNSAPTANTGHVQIELRNQFVSVIALNPSGTKFVAATDSGVVAYQLHGATATQEAPDAPATFALAQNYPNPFNPTTTIAFDVPVKADVRLRVFDLLGRHVASIASGVYAPGRYHARFDATALGSGMYLYRLEAGGTALTRALTVFK